MSNFSSSNTSTPNVGEPLMTQLNQESSLVESLKEMELSRKESERHLRHTIQRLKMEKAARQARRRRTSNK